MATNLPVQLDQAAHEVVFGFDVGAKSDQNGNIHRFRLGCGSVESEPLPIW